MPQDDAQDDGLIHAWGDRKGMVPPLRIVIRGEGPGHAKVIQTTPETDEDEERKKQAAALIALLTRAEGDKTS